MNIEEKIKINFPLKIGFLKKDKEKPYFKAGEIMTREEVNKFLYSNEFWNEVILMEND